MNTKKYSGKKLLIIEDEPAMLEILAQTFMRDGWEVRVANDGVDGEKQAESFHPNLIILDILIPRQNGLALLKKIRGLDRWGKKVPILLLTNLSVDDAITDAFAEYAPVYYLLKTDVGLRDITTFVKHILPTNVHAVV